MVRVDVRALLAKEDKLELKNGEGCSLMIENDGSDDDNLDDITDNDDEEDDPDWDEIGPEKPTKAKKLGKAIAEGEILSTKKKPRKSRGKKSTISDDSGDTDDSDFEEVHSDEGLDEIIPRTKSNKNVEVIIEPADLKRKSTKGGKPRDRQAELEAAIKRMLRRAEIGRYKIALAMFLARGIRLIKICNNSLIRNLGLSLLEDRFLLPFTDITSTGTTAQEQSTRTLRHGKRAKIEPKDEPKNKIRKSVKATDAPESTRDFLNKFLEWFTNEISICTDEDIKESHLKSPFIVNLIDCFAKKEITSLIELCVLFVACIKSARQNLPVRILNIFRMSSTEKLDFWVEVYEHETREWVCVDLCNSKIGEPDVLNELNKPFYYLLSFDIDRNCVKPCEQFYCAQWYLSSFRKERIDEKWWQALLRLYKPSLPDDGNLLISQTSSGYHESDLADDLKSQKLLADQDMPKSDAAFKSHPLYILTKHLLKFQAIYPPDLAPLGYFKGEPIYPRECLHVLHSRETWLRQARTVKLYETPYKIVKSRPKWDRNTREVKRDLPLELFGLWQTEPYDPPTASDGKVPRNSYGNVDMYQPCMLPKGCVHLHLPGLIRVANKLGIDCAPAVIGFDNHCSGGSHPVMDGFIVCQEHEKILKSAWKEEQINARKREEEKRNKIIIDNWKRLLKAAVIREKLRIKYKNS